jgi:hypothetical protein
MKLLGRTRWTRITTGVALTLLAVALCAPDARGSCGHYVLVGAKSAGTATPDAPPTGQVLPPAVPEDKSRPCSGPSCSRGPVGLPAAPPATTPAPGEQWGCVVVQHGPTASGPAALLAEDPRPRPLRLGSGVYHPPRAASPSALA